MTSPRISLLTLTVSTAVLSIAPAAMAQGAPTGTPPADAKAIVADPNGPTAAPTIAPIPDGTSATLSAGGISSNGNSNMLAMTGKGSLETRFNNNGLGFSFLANYGESAAAPGSQKLIESTENGQIKLRYDRYLSDRFSLFLQDTLFHDKFEGVDFRNNVDPGVKYLIVRETATSFWAELGYDFQFQSNNVSYIQAQGAMMTPPVAVTVGKTETLNSVRAYLGVRQAFSKEVTLSSGLELLQGFTNNEDTLVNFDVLFAAKIAGGFALGVGDTLRYDRLPLPGIKTVDNSLTVNLIFSYDSKVAAPAAAAPAPPLAAPCPASTTQTGSPTSVSGEPTAPSTMNHGGASASTSAPSTGAPPGAPDTPSSGSGTVPPASSSPPPATPR